MEVSQERIRIRLKAYDHKLLDKWVKEIIKTVEQAGSRVKGPIPLPTKVSRYTVLRSPHVDKKSREQFEMRIHKRLLDVLISTPMAMEALMKMNLPTGIYVEIKS